MKILISGGTGLIGKELGKALVTAGHELVLVSRDKASTPFSAPYPHQSISWSELNQFVNEVQGVEAIINLAGAGIAEKRWSKKYKSVLLSSRKDSTEQLVALAHYLKDKLKIFISTSAIGYYGNKKDKLMMEDDSSGKSFLARICVEWEKALEPLDVLENVRKVVFRVGMVLSEKGGALERMVSVFQTSMGGTLGGGAQYISWIDIEDLVRMYVFALDHYIVGTYNAVAPNPVSSKEFTHSLAQTLGVSDLLPVPAFILRLYMGEMADIILHSHRVSNDKIRRAGFQFNYSRLQDCFLTRVLNFQSYENVMFFEQWLPVPKEKIFSFFSRPGNLQKVTPSKFRLKVLGSSTKELQNGTRIKFRFSRYLFFFLCRFIIIQCEPSEVLVSKQEVGPCKKWINFYHFRDFGGGVLITNKVNIILPYWLLIISRRIIRNIKYMFHFRKEKLLKMFSQSDN